MEINTHEKFMEEILEQKISKKELHEILYANGYKGTEKEVIADMLGAMSYTTAYSSTEEFTEEEYFQMLVKEMNINY